MTAKYLVLVSRWLSFNDVVSLAKRETCFVPIIVKDEGKNNAYAYALCRVLGRGEYRKKYFSMVRIGRRYKMIGRIN